jgi:hypothetical protein
MAVFWDVAPYYLDVSEVVSNIRAITVVSTSETSVIIYQTTQRNMPESSHLHNRRRDNLKSHMTMFKSDLH